MQIKLMIIVRDLAPELIRAATQSPAITLTGPRQSGKTTLCQSTSVSAKRYT